MCVCAGAVRGRCQHGPHQGGREVQAGGQAVRGAGRRVSHRGTLPLVCVCMLVCVCTCMGWMDGFSGGQAVRGAGRRVVATGHWASEPLVHPSCVCMYVYIHVCTCVCTHVSLFFPPPPGLFVCICRSCACMCACPAASSTSCSTSATPRRSRVSRQPESPEPGRPRANQDAAGARNVRVVPCQPEHN